MEGLLWWHWGVLGFGLVVLELVVPSFFIVWFGLAAFLVMGSLLLFPELSLAMQLLIWTLSSIIMVFLWFRVFKTDQHKSLIGRSSANIVGEVGMIVEPVAPFKNGKVRFQKPLVGSDLWDCISEEEIEIGQRVRVTSVEGNLLAVQKQEKSS